MKYLLSLMILLINMPLTQAQEITTQQPDVKDTVAPPPPPPSVELPVPMEDILVFNFGLGGGYVLAMQSAAFTSLPGIPSCCPEYTGGNGSGIFAFAEVHVPASGPLYILGRIGFSSATVKMETSEPTWVRSGTQVLETSFMHTLENTHTMISIEPLLEYRMTRNVGIYGGPRIAIMSGATYDQREVLATDAPVEYTTGLSSNNASSGDIPNASSLQVGVALGIRALFPLNSRGSWMLAPDVSWVPLFTNMVQDRSWTTSGIRAGISIIMGVYKSEPIQTPLRP